MRGGSKKRDGAVQAEAVAPAPARARRRRPIALAPLRGFASAARHQSFTEAALELKLTQSAISRQVASLEDEIGQKLFARRTRALELTAAGQRLLRSVGPALAGIDGAVEEIRGLGASRRVAISTYPSFASLWLVPRLAGFQRAHPDIEVRIDADSRMVDLEAEGFDLVLRRCRPEQAPAGALELLRENVTPALSPGLLNRHGGRLRRVEDLLRLPLIEMDDNSAGGLAAMWTAWLEFAGIPPPLREGSRSIVVTFIDQSMQAAARGQGVALAPSPFGDDMVAEGTLVMPFAQLRSSTGYAMYLLLDRVSRRREAVAQLANWLLAEFQAPRPRQR